jgi:hypothetical protein
VPSALIGLTNQQLVSNFGLAMGGILAPGRLPGGPESNGTLGTVATYLKVVTLAAESYRTHRRLHYGFYFRVDGGSAQDGGTYNLIVGWNLLRFTVSRLPRSLFVLGL